MHERIKERKKTVRLLFGDETRRCEMMNHNNELTGTEFQTGKIKKKKKVKKGPTKGERERRRGTSFLSNAQGTRDDLYFSFTFCLHVSS